MSRPKLDPATLRWVADSLEQMAISSQKAIDYIMPTLDSGFDTTTMLPKSERAILMYKYMGRKNLCMQQKMRLRSLATRAERGGG